VFQNVSEKVGGTLKGRFEAGWQIVVSLSITAWMTAVKILVGLESL
jgi:hypothetical protein